MNPNSPHYLFDPESIGWLHRKHKKKEPIYKEDIIRLLTVDPSNAADTVLQQYLLPALTDRLNRPRGRPKHDPRYLVRLTMADILIEDRAKEIAVERRRARTGEKGRKEPRLQAAEEVARFLNLSIGGRALLNAISAHKIRPKKVKAAPSPS